MNYDLSQTFYMKSKEKNTNNHSQINLSGFLHPWIILLKGILPDKNFST